MFIICRTVNTIIKMTVLSLPGLGFVQATHFVSSALFSNIHESHSHAPSGLLNLSPNPMNPVETGTEGVDTVFADEKAEGRVSDGLSPVPGLAVSHALHLTASGLFSTRHVSHSQVPAGLENIVPKPVVVVVVVVEVLLLSSPTEVAVVGLLSNGSVEEGLGFGAEQATHFESDGLFCTKQTSHSHEPAWGLNKLPNPSEEEREEVVEVEKVAVDCVVVCWGVVSGPGELRAIGEAKPKQNF